MPLRKELLHLFLNAEFLATTHDLALCVPDNKLHLNWL